MGLRHLYCSMSPLKPPETMARSLCVHSVNVTFVNFLGQKTTLPGRIGQSLLDVAQEHGYNWLEGAFPCRNCVV